MSRSQVLMELDGVSKRFGGLLALDTINMQVYEGEILGISDQMDRVKRRFLI